MTSHDLAGMPNRARRLVAMPRLFFRNVFQNADPTKAVLIGYVAYVCLGWVLLSLPFAQVKTVAALDNLFIAASAVSTTGLVSIDPGSSYTFFGQVVVILLIQMGGLGYMTLSSFVALSISHRLSSYRQTVTRTAFSLPEHFNLGRFITRVVIFTLVVEALGALALYPQFVAEGVAQPLWSAVFHSISAFCTAGFSLFPNSFEGLADRSGIVLVIAALSYLGAIGFIVLSEIWDLALGRRRAMRFTTKVILTITINFSVLGTAVFFLAEPTVASLEPSQRLLAAFFQVMTASTTVGFNTVPIGALAPATLVLMFALMAFGASPSGTGGGLKSTTLAVLWGQMWSVLKRRETVQVMNRSLPPDRLNQAFASLSFYFVVLGVALFALLLTETAPFQVVVFEAISALGTVGLSMGLTGSLTPLGKFIVILLMVIGRVGVLTFGIAIVARAANRDDKADTEIVI